MNSRLVRDMTPPPDQQDWRHPITPGYERSGAQFVRLRRPSHVVTITRLGTQVVQRQPVMERVGQGSGRMVGYAEVTLTSASCSFFSLVAVDRPTSGWHQAWDK